MLVVSWILLLVIATSSYMPSRVSSSISWAHLPPRWWSLSNHCLQFGFLSLPLESVATWICLCRYTNRHLKSSVPQIIHSKTWPFLISIRHHIYRFTHPTHNGSHHHLFLSFHLHLVPSPVQQFLNLFLPFCLHWSFPEFKPMSL